ncbi:MAG TPA: SHOCT domain-containing protein [Anaerolineae bacterium]|jgi:putative membrane protein|nr:SHOCT domain-containing protein [Anaerolineae bacterium]
MMMLFWILAIAGGAYAIAEASRRRRAQEQEKKPGALEILQERYARGEISKEEYESRKRDLAS